MHQPAILHDAPHHAGNVRVEAIVLHRRVDLGEHRGVLGEHRLDEDTADDRHGDRDGGAKAATGAGTGDGHEHSKAADEAHL